MLLDTHVWVWFATDSFRLPQSLIDSITRSSSDLLLSSVSIWETLLAMEKGRIRASTSPEEHVRAWLRTYPLRVVAIDAEVAFLSRSLAFRHEDPADRFIAATAYHKRVPLATLDSNLRSLPWLDVLPERSETELNSLA